MSTPTHLAALDGIRDSLNMLREVVKDLPVEALDWAPGARMNSITVLICHALPSTRFWIRAGCGQNPSHRAYVATERNPSFDMKGEGAGFLLDSLNNVDGDIEFTLRDGREEHLAAIFAMDDEPDEPPLTGAGCLVHAASHLREHAGQAELTRALWLARAVG